MKVFVTGATGFLGRVVLRRLLEEGGSHVCALIRPGKRSGVAERLELPSWGKSVSWLEARLHDRSALARALRDVDVVLHIAASKRGSVPAQVFNTVVGTERLFEACAEAGVGRVVLISSFGVMDAAGTPRGACIDERTPLDPHPERRDPYTFAKHMQESRARRLAEEHGLPLVVLRPGVIMGPPHTVLTSRVGQDLFGVFLHLGNRMQVPITDVDNCAAAVVCAARAPGVEGRTYCIVDDDLPTSRYLLRRYRREVRRIKSIAIPWRVMRRLAWLNERYSRRTHNHLPAVFTPYEVDSKWKGHSYTNARAKSELGWRPEQPMGQALDRVYRALARGAEGGAC